MQDPKIGSFIGIDVSKARLDVAIDEDGDEWHVTNDMKGIELLIERLRQINPQLIVIESTGGLERPVLIELDRNAFPIALVNPKRVREFARAIGLLAKTDRLDARLLARFARDAKPARTQLPSPDEQHLSSLMARRRQILDMRTAERNRLCTAPPDLRASISEHISWLQEHLKNLEKDIDDFNHDDLVRQE